MTSNTPAYEHYQPSRLSVRASTLQNGLLWLLVFSGFFVLFEPAPYDLLAIAACGFFLMTGLRWNKALNPLFFLLFLYHLGAAICLMGFLENERDTVQWTIVGIFLAITGIFIAMAVSEQPLKRATVVCNAWVWGAFIASTIGVLAYFGIMPSADTFLIYGNRVKATFKDANVFGPFLVVPATYLIQKIYDRGMKALPTTLPLLGMIVLAIVLTFSRGAWGALAATVMLMTLLTFLTSPSPRERTRIIILSILGIVTVIALVGVLLSLESVGETLRARAALDQEYDVGAVGRFGRHVLGFQLAMEHPLGIGMLQFANYYGEDPHNTYLNAFLSYTWLGGFAFIALTVLTLIISFKTVFMRTPWQKIHICSVSAFTVMMIEAWIIDVDHWRHMYLILGLCWGLAAASLQWQKESYRPL